MTKTQFIVPNFEKKSNRLYLTLRKNEGIVLIFDEKRPTLLQFIYFLHLYCHLRISNHPLKHKKGEFSTKKHKKGATCCCCCAAADSRILLYPGDSTTRRYYIQYTVQWGDRILFCCWHVGISYRVQFLEF